MLGFLDIKDPKHAALLMTVLKAHCKAHGIARECPERLEVARRLVKLFEGGARTPEALREALAESCEAQDAALPVKRPVNPRRRR